MTISDEVMDGQQLNCSYSKFPEVLNGGRVTQRGVRSPDFFGYIGMALRKAFYVHLIDDGVVIGYLGGPIPFPIESGVDDDTFGEKRTAICVGRLQIFGLSSNGIAEKGVVPLNRSRDSAGVRIN